MWSSIYALMSPQRRMFIEYQLNDRKLFENNNQNIYSNLPQWSNQVDSMFSIWTNYRRIKSIWKISRPFKKVALLCVKIHCIVATIMEPFNKRKKPEAKHSTLQKKDKGNFIQNEHQISQKRSCRKYRTMNQNRSCCRKKNILVRSMTKVLEYLIFRGSHGEKEEKD